jgi:hypothetical protein
MKMHLEVNKCYPTSKHFTFWVQLVLYVEYIIYGCKFSSLCYVTPCLVNSNICNDVVYG